MFDLEQLFTERSAELAKLRANRQTEGVICRDSTPVLFFGDIANAAALSVGLNPSWHEFLADDKEPLSGTERRFLHMSELSGEASRDAQLALQRMTSYFTRSPDVCYTGWFDPLERLHVTFSFGLRSGASAHTDILSCFATDPAWSDKKIAASRATLSSSGYETFLRVIESSPRVHTLFAIGSAGQELSARSGVPLRAIPTPFDKMDKCKSFRPVLSWAKWPFAAGRNISVIAVRPNWNLPTKPLTPTEVSQLPRYLEEVSSA